MDLAKALKPNRVGSRILDWPGACAALMLFTTPVKATKNGNPILLMLSGIV